jgi:hypothetical protein
MSRGLYPFGHSRELLARKKNLGLQFELIWRQFYIGNRVLAPNEFKLEPEIFFSGQQLAAVTKGIQSPGHGAKKPLLTHSLVE